MLASEVNIGGIYSIAICRIVTNVRVLSKRHEGHIVVFEVIDLDTGATYEVRNPNRFTPLEE